MDSIPSTSKDRAHRAARRSRVTINQVESHLRAAQRRLVVCVNELDSDGRSGAGVGEMKLVLDMINAALGAAALIREPRAGVSRG